MIQGITSVTLAHGRETVSAQCLEAFADAAEMVRRPCLARGGARKGGILEQDVDRLSGEPGRIETSGQVRRLRACEVEHHSMNLGARVEHLI
jgi:hypothetical protein